jgi:hypothetical protein
VMRHAIDDIAGGRGVLKRSLRWTMSIPSEGGLASG